MSDLALVIGNSGSGKSSSMRNLNPNETFVINVAGKPLPFKGAKKKYTQLDPAKGEGNMLSTSSFANIIKVLKYIDAKRPEIKQIIIDDAGYTMSFDAMDRVKEKGFEKFTEMAQNFYLMLKAASTLRDDLKVFVFGHEESNGDPMNPKRKFKTSGKLIDNAIGVEGLCTYVFFAEAEPGEDGKVEYKFVTQTDGTTTAKTPMGCFDEEKIDNDLAFVITKIDEYNEG